MNKWTYTTLGKISEIITGPFGSQLHQSDYVEQGIPVVMPQDIDNRKVNYALFQVLFFQQDFVDYNATKSVLNILLLMFQMHILKFIKICLLTERLKKL